MSTIEVPAERRASRTLRRRAIDLLRRRWWARLIALGVGLILVALLPVPWLVADLDDPPGMAWKLDGRIQFNGRTIDPPGTWVGLTAGRPPLVAEVVRGWLVQDVEEPRDMRQGSTFNSPAVSEPAAIAVGLLAAGVPVDVVTMVEARGPLLEGLPARIVIASVNGRKILTPGDWVASIESLGAENEMTTEDGQILNFSGGDFPYREVATMQVPTDLDVSLAGWGRLIPQGLYRNLSLGRSHGLLLALAAYSDATGSTLAAGRTVAATGLIRGDGTISSIGGLAAKARAANRVGADVLFYPAAQQCEQAAILEDLGPTAMTMIPVASLGEAIEALGDGEGWPDPDAGCA